MEAKTWEDTVMSNKEIASAIFSIEDDTYEAIMRAVTQAQAEITWDKAIREVVECIKNPLVHAKESVPSSECPECIRQAKLKEWGVDKIR